MSLGALKILTPDGFRVVGSGLVDNPDTVTGVSSFNTRTGSVTPQKGDYSADMIPFSDGETFQQKYNSGELKGEDGTRGAIYHKVTTAPASYTTAIGDYTPKYRILIDTALSQSGQADMIVGDVIRQSYYDYFVDYIADGYAYISTSRISVRGTTGADGDAGYTPVKGTDYWTDADKAEMVADVLAALPDAAEVTF